MLAYAGGSTRTLVPSYSTICRPAFIPAPRLSQAFIRWGFGTVPGFAWIRCASFKPFGPLALVQQALAAIIFAALCRFRGPALFHGSRPSSRLGAPCWPSGLTVRRSRPPTAAAELRALAILERLLWFFHSLNTTPIHLRPAALSSRTRNVFVAVALKASSIQGRCMVRTTTTTVSVLGVLPTAAPTNSSEPHSQTKTVWVVEESGVLFLTKLLMKWQTERLDSAGGSRNVGGRTAVTQRVSWAGQARPSYLLWGLKPSKQFKIQPGLPMATSGMPFSRRSTKMARPRHTSFGVEPAVQLAATKIATNG